MQCFVEYSTAGKLVWIGETEDRSSTLCSSPLTEVCLGFAGINGDSHSGLNRPSCVRVNQLYAEGTEIRNTRQVSIVSAEELRLIANDMGLEQLAPSFVGANLVVEGFPDFTFVPCSSRLQFDSGATVVIDMVNLPCQLPAREIEKVLPGMGKGFKSAARDRRGVTGWVEREGAVHLNDRVSLFIPNQSPWRFSKC